jgi:putative SOS response-associated peptidase YedK
MPATDFCEYEDTKPRKTSTWFGLSEDRLVAFACLARRTEAEERAV